MWCIWIKESKPHISHKKRCKQLLIFESSQFTLTTTFEFVPHPTSNVRGLKPITHDGRWKWKFNFYVAGTNVPSIRIHLCLISSNLFVGLPFKTKNEMIGLLPCQIAMKWLHSCGTGMMKGWKHLNKRLSHHTRIVRLHDFRVTLWMSLKKIIFIYWKL